jgi:hypothetical protein
MSVPSRYTYWATVALRRYVSMCLTRLKQRLASTNSHSCRFVVQICFTAFSAKQKSEIWDTGKNTERSVLSILRGVTWQHFLFVLLPRVLQGEEPSVRELPRTTENSVAVLNQNVVWCENTRRLIVLKEPITCLTSFDAAFFFCVHFANSLTSLGIERTLTNVILRDVNMYTSEAITKQISHLRRRV